jgi:hypothetical protein
MAPTVAEVLVGTLEKIGVRHIFGLIGDSLNPLADAVRHSTSNGSRCATRKAPCLQPPVKPSSPAGSAYARVRPGR